MLRLPGSRAQRVSLISNLFAPSAEPNSRPALLRLGLALTPRPPLPRVLERGRCWFLLSEVVTIERGSFHFRPFASSAFLTPLRFHPLRLRSLCALVLQPSASSAVNTPETAQNATRAAALQPPSTERIA